MNIAPQLFIYLFFFIYEARALLSASSLMLEISVLDNYLKIYTVLAI